MQVRRIRKTMRLLKSAGEESERYRRRSGGQELRPEIASALAKRWKHTPKSPLLVTGPEGSGKATLIAQSLSSRPMSLYLSTTMSHARSGDAFLRTFADMTGFMVQPSGIFIRSLLRTREEKSRINQDDIDAMFMATTEALREERDAGWPHGVPVLCIEELHNQTKDMLDVKDPSIRRFLDWALYVSGAQLAHVVFLTSIPVALRFQCPKALKS